MKRSNQSPKRHRLMAPVVGFIAACIGTTGHAQDGGGGKPFPDYPLQTGVGSIPPNIMFVMDDSGSMGSTIMGVTDSIIERHELSDNPKSRSYINNTIYYNPNIDYEPWMRADGSRYPGGDSYGAAFSHYDLPEGEIDLGDPGSCYKSIMNAKYYEVCGGQWTFWVPKSAAVVNPGTSASNFDRYVITSGTPQVKKCNNVSGSTSGCALMTPTGRTQEEELRNFAIWFSYHSTRMKAAKAGASEAFGQLGINYRVGYDSIWGYGKGAREGTPATGPAYPIPVGKNDGLFDGDNREDWFDWMQKARNIATTPLREALRRAGQYYSGAYSNVASPWGPGSAEEQLSCRQSYTILTTDGFWNGSLVSSVGNSDGSDGVEVEDLNGDPVSTYAPAAPYADEQEDTLADVAMHYWKRDLQPELMNNVPSSPANPAFWQHMSTFGISIGVKGALDQASVAEVLDEGTSINGSPKPWPKVSSGNGAKIDDLLHAAVNGRGEFVAATNPEEFANALKNSLATIANRQASGASVASNGPSLSTDSLLFEASYTSGAWSGDLTGVSIAGGNISNSVEWSMAQVARSDSEKFRSRKVWTSNGVGGVEFPTSVQLGQLERSPLSERGVSGKDNANYIKGYRDLEGVGRSDLRQRSSPIGDIVNSSPFYVKETESVFVGANDGMLHAVNANDGHVRFSYVPKGLDFNALAQISSQDYQHRFFVDGGIDVYTETNANGGVKMSYLVAALGRGGKGVFGLDVSNPDNTAQDGLEAWDKTFQGAGSGAEADIEEETGYVLGAPLVRRGNNDKVLAIYGNGIDSKNGNAVLIIRDAENGNVVTVIKAGGGDGNGLSEARAADLDGNGTADVIYAGDLKGNLWKFDISSSDSGNWRVADAVDEDGHLLGGNKKLPLFVARDPSGKRQPITGGVALARESRITGDGRVFVIFGTGSYYKNSDLEDTQVQSVYAVIDENQADQVHRVRRSELEQRGIEAEGKDSQGRDARAWQRYSELPAEKKGWYANLGFPKAGERVVTAPVIRGRALWFSSIIPAVVGGCEVGGTGYLNSLDVFTGTNPSSPAGSYSFIDADKDGTGNDYLEGHENDPDFLLTSVDLGVGMPSQPTFVDDDVYVGGSDAKLGKLEGLPVNGGPHRLRWRELVDQE